jgi:subtilase family protein
MLSSARGGVQAPSSQGVTWGGLPLSARRVATVATAFLLAAGVAGPAMATAASAATPSAAALVPVLVQETTGAGNGPERAVESFGGSVGQQFSVFHGFSAKVPGDRLDALRAVPGVSGVTEDAGLTLDSAAVQDQASQPGSLYTVANKVTGAADMWKAGYTGKGVDVAVIDSGVVPVDGLSGSKVVYGPDLTLENNTSAKNLDTYGHGTAMSSIIAGRDAAATGSYAGDSADFVGMAPDSRIVSIKVADAKGQTDVSQAIAAIDWAGALHSPEWP